jgi:hypothetical protein
MKHTIWICVTVILMTAILAGCIAPQATTGAPTAPTTAPTQQPTVFPTEKPTQPTTTPPTEATEPEEGTAAHYIQVVYAQQIQRYRTAFSQQWSEEDCISNGLSPLPLQQSQGDLLDNMGVAFVDLNQDDSWELILGTVWNADTDPLVYEIWTLTDGVPRMVAQSDGQNRYYLQYSREDAAWYVALEITRSEDHYGSHYLMFQDGSFEIIQAIVYQGANSSAPWFMAYDMDMDTSNDESIDESTAGAIVNSNRNLYTAADYIPYRLLP